MTRDELDYALRFVGGSFALVMLIAAAIVVGVYVLFAGIGACVEVITR